jgi:predicted AlkP superfamily phosphohydrolase/phosphomutase
MKRTMLALCTVVLVVLACSCQSRPTAGGTEYATAPAQTAPAATPPPVPTAPPAQRRAVILLVLDGARQDWIAKYIQNGTMPNLGVLAQRGVMAEYLQPVEPVLPIPSYLALSRGSFPNDTGLASTGPQESPSALSQSAPSLESGNTTSEPFWRTAMRNGLRTATVFWPAASPDELDIPAQDAGWSTYCADYMVATAESDIPSAQHVIPLHEASGWDSAPASFSPFQEGTLRITSGEGSTVATLHLLALDDQDDATTAYDLVLLDDDKDLANGHTEVRLGKWAGVTVSPRLHSGAYLCFTASTSLTVTLYQSRLSYNQAHPADLLRAINDQFDFPPPAPDSAALRAGWLSPQQYSEMAERRARWMGEVVLYVYQTYAPDLLLTAQTIIADSAGPFLLVDGRQEGYSPEKAELYASFLARAHAIADENLSHLLELVNLADTAVFVVSTHGLMPVHTTVSVNAILSNAKLLQVKTGVGPTQIDTSKSKAWAAATGGNAHVYINLQGREWPGLVAPEDYGKVQDQIIKALQETKDETGQPVFARILKQEELGTLHLESPQAGDVFAQAAPGYALSDELGAKKVLVPALCCAQEGFSADAPEMHGIFIASGDGLVSGKTIPPVSILDVAPTVAQALRFHPAVTIQGHAIEGVWR